jgi:succinoglycan biosynthesis transport protein ExoP
LDIGSSEPGASRLTYDDVEEQPAGPNFEKLWATARRRRWWILLPMFLCWLLIWVVSWLLPATYQSEALFLIEQQKVPEHYVEPNVTLNLQDRLERMTQQILSRSRLQKTIDRFHLYPPSRGLEMILQSGDPVERMRKDIKIELVQAPGHPGELTAFKIHYSGETPALAQRVNSELTTLFIDENVKSEQELSESTTAFLEYQLAGARTKLEEQEAKVREFKASHVDELPSQLQSNVSVLSSLQAQLDNTRRQLDNANQQKLYLESQLNEMQSAKGGLGKGDTAATAPEALEQLLVTLQQNLIELRARYTDNHPEIIGLKHKIAETEEMKKDLENQMAGEEKAGRVSHPENPAAVEHRSGGYSATSMQLRSQLKANALEIQNYQKREKGIESQIYAYQSRLNMSPKMEEQLGEISRGYEESKANYDSLLKKQYQSQLATSLAQRQQGEQFRIVDSPSLPARPDSPNHVLFSLAGLAIGAIVGIGLTALVEVTNPRIHQEKDLSELGAFRVLVCIPHLDTPEEPEYRMAFRRREILAAATMILLMVGGSLYSLYKG